MIPEERLSTELIFAALIVPNPQPSELVSRESGGIALSDPTWGLEYQVWTMTVVPSGDPFIPDEVLIEAPNTPSTLLFSDLNIESASLAFDQNARPTVAYVAAGIAKLFWYDSLIEQFVTNTFEELIGEPGSTSPRCTLDDHRTQALRVSDIIVVYIRDGNLYFIAQRDRFELEYLLYPDINLAIINPSVGYVAMNQQLRLQIQIRGNFYGG